MPNSARPAPGPATGAAAPPDDLATAADLDLRLVRYFTVVAEQRHFGRAAAILLIAQPSLSRQVRRLEQQLGVRLLDRTPQGTRLTEAGEVFLPRTKSLLPSAAQQRRPDAPPSPVGSPSATQLA